MTYGLEIQNKFSIDDISWIFDSKFVPGQEQTAVLATIEGDILIVNLTPNHDDTNPVSPIIKRLKEHHKGKSVRRLAFLNDHDLISASKTIKIYDLNAEKFSRQLSNQGSKVYSMKVVDENLIVTGDDSGSLRMFDLRQGLDPIWTESPCQEYISDLDLDLAKRMLLATSGDGSLSAFNIRTKKLFMQSEPFDAGFQSVRFLGHRNKVVVGAEDGALNIFNVNEYGNISDRFPLQSSRRKHGECSVDAIEVISNELLVATGSDCRLRLVQMFPNRVLYVANEYDNSVESLAWNPDSELILSSETNTVLVHKVVTMDSGSEDVGMEDANDNSDKDSDDEDDDSDSDDDDSDDQSNTNQRKQKKRPNQSSATKSGGFFADL